LEAGIFLLTRFAHFSLSAVDDEDISSIALIHHSNEEEEAAVVSPGKKEQQKTLTLTLTLAKSTPQIERKGEYSNSQ
jgi:hypothetical protein